MSVKNDSNVNISQKKAEKSGLTAVETELTGKCSYPACKHSEDEKTNQFMTVKNTDYKFHPDCYNLWSNENRGMGRFKQEDKVAALDEQTGKTTKEAKTEAPAAAKK